MYSNKYYCLKKKKKKKKKKNLLSWRLIKPLHLPDTFPRPKKKELKDRGNFSYIGLTKFWNIDLTRERTKKIGSTYLDSIQH